MHPIPEFKNLVEMATYRANTQPHTTYVNFIKDNGACDDTSTFLSLHEDAQRIAAYLQAKGLKGRNVLLLFPSGIDYVRTFFGCLYAGATPVPAYPPMGAKDLTRLQNIANDCNAGAILSNQVLAPTIENWTSNLGHHNSVPSLAVEDMLAGNPDAGFEPYQADPNELAFLQYTSGSTGHPKGVEITHGNLLANFQQIEHGFLHGNEQLSEIDQLRLVIWLPPFHDMGLIGGVLTPVYIGAQVSLMAPLTFLKRPMVWLKTIAEQKAHVSGGPNFGYQYCVQKISEDQAEQLDLSNWHIAFNGAEPIQAQALHNFAERFKTSGFKSSAFLPCYGLAEASLFVAGSPSGRGAHTLNADLSQLAQGRYKNTDNVSGNNTLVSSGTFALDTDVRIVNPQTLHPCKEGEVGEIWINSPSVARGYWNKPQFSKSVFQATIKGDANRKAFLRSGDLGFVQDGELYVTGRIKEMIIIAGRNHYPQDIEQTLQSANPSFKGGGGAAFSITREGEEELVIMQEISRAAGNQADYKMLAAEGVKAISSRHGITPHALVLVSGSTIPKTSSGKIQRAAAKQHYQEGNVVPVYVWQANKPSTKPATTEKELDNEFVDDWYSELHREVQHWVADKLDIENHHIDLDVTFSDLGVNSIETVELVDRLQDRIGRVIPATELLRYPTVKALISHFAEELEQKELALREEA
ncbi:MAG: AMP-dependent synthetase [Ketobacter sp.]|nr:MAG: AMP-dependent synthetase [Ketobacter sp.]